jgi:hypothetical protein
MMDTKETELRKRCEALIRKSGDEMAPLYRSEMQARTGRIYNFDSYEVQLEWSVWRKVIADYLADVLADPIPIANETDKKIVPPVDLRGMLQYVLDETLAAIRRDR